MSRFCHFDNTNLSLNRDNTILNKEGHSFSDTRDIKILYTFLDCTFEIINYINYICYFKITKKNKVKINIFYCFNYFVFV